VEINLNRPYGLQPSPPAVDELTFFSRQSKDMLFTDGIAEITCHAGIHSVGMTWNLCRNMFKTPFAIGIAVPEVDNNYTIEIDTDKLYPGFYDLRVTLDAGNGTTINGVCGFGYKSEQMPIADTRPADFNDFWKVALAELAAVPLNAKTGTVKHFNAEEINDYNLASAAMPADYDPSGHKCEEVEAFKIEFSSVKGKRIFGWLAKPVGNSPFPAMLVLPGAGCDSRPIPLEHARHGYLAIDLQVHGQDVDQKKYEEICGYNYDPIYEPIKDNYFRRMYLNAVQAVNYLLSRPDVDANRIAVVGGSQGGRLSVIVAALHPKVKAIVPAIAHYGNLPHLKWAEKCNALQGDGMDFIGTPMPDANPENICCAYYDVMNFAPDVKCPTLMNAGMIDPVSYTSGVFAIYNRLGTANKSMIPISGFAHDWSAEFDRSAWRWLDKIWG